MDRSLFGFIIRYSKRDQLLIVPLVVGTMVVYYLSLDLPKTIINQAIQGDGFPSPTPPPASSASTSRAWSTCSPCR